MATKTLMTAEQFLRTGPETDGFELIRGELVPMPPPKGRHGEVCGNAVYVLKGYLKARRQGTLMCNDAGIITERGPDTVRGADVAVFLNPSWQGQPAPDRYTEEPPDLVVEVRSPSQGWPAILGKVTEYLRMGARLVWLIDPQRRRLTVFSQLDEPTTFAAESELDGGDILPGFRCRVADLLD